MMMQQMNREMNGQLSLAIKIFSDDYPKPFLHELICSQLDADRLDYLSRDAFLPVCVKATSVRSASYVCST